MFVELKRLGLEVSCGNTGKHAVARLEKTAHRSTRMATVGLALEGVIRAELAVHKTLGTGRPRETPCADVYSKSVAVEPINKNPCAEEECKHAWGEDRSLRFKSVGKLAFRPRSCIHVARVGV